MWDQSILVRYSRHTGEPVSLNGNTGFDERKEELSMNENVLKVMLIRLEELRNNTGKVSFQRGVWTNLLGLIHADQTFEGKLNSSELELPIADGLKVNLSTGSVSQRKPEDLFDHCIDLGIVRDEECVTFVEKFFDDLFLGDEQVIGFIRRLMGYCLTGSNKEQKFFIFHNSDGGTGRVH